jgi:hypothetical protein
MYSIAVGANYHFSCALVAFFATQALETDDIHHIKNEIWILAHIYLVAASGDRRQRCPNRRAAIGSHKGL